MDTMAFNTVINSCAALAGPSCPDPGCQEIGQNVSQRTTTADLLGRECAAGSLAACSGPMTRNINTDPAQKTCVKAGATQQYATVRRQVLCLAKVSNDALNIAEMRARAELLGYTCRHCDGSGRTAKAPAPDFPMQRHRRTETPQVPAAGYRAEQACRDHFSRSAGTLQHEIAAKEQICKVHGLSPTALWLGVVGAVAGKARRGSCLFRREDQLIL